MKGQTRKNLIKAVKILELSTPFSFLDIKRAYKERAKILHPDRDPSEIDRENAMKELNWAYHLLLKHFEEIKIPFDLFITSTQTDEEWIKNRFYYDWMPPKDDGVETA